VGGTECWAKRAGDIWDIWRPWDYTRETPARPAALPFGAPTLVGHHSSSLLADDWLGMLQAAATSPAIAIHSPQSTLPFALFALVVCNPNACPLSLAVTACLRPRRRTAVRRRPPQPFAASRLSSGQRGSLVACPAPSSAPVNSRGAGCRPRSGMGHRSRKFGTTAPGAVASIDRATAGRPTTASHLSGRPFC
jgi:hypothetical protein